jgi:hypothetical protein
MTREKASRMYALVRFRSVVVCLSETEFYTALFSILSCLVRNFFHYCSLSLSHYYFLVYSFSISLPLLFASCEILHCPVLSR